MSTIILVILILLLVGLVLAIVKAKNNNNFCLYSFFRNLSKLGIGVQMHIVSISQERSKCDFALEIYQRYF